VKHIVQAHGGELLIASAVGRGTIVTVLLPRGAREARASSAAS
jgi:signal transduction histidine kinase